NDDHDRVFNYTLVVPVGLQPPKYTTVGDEDTRHYASHTYMVSSGENSGIFGRISEFNGIPSAWTDYKAQVEFYFQANGLGTTTDRSEAIFLASCGQSLFSLVRTLLFPQALSEVSLNQIFELL